ncbi:MAG: hypothetical protein PHH54_02025 [Candidatus Nanoarchaeia archaeon]|nr:hypothetical protein [Candidatus Nanoarchaeia archaeon]MDD5740740.1 hypothetical protein [Candidatus Nanoarchaeia archaeon]
MAETKAEKLDRLGKFPYENVQRGEIIFVYNLKGDVFNEVDILLYKITESKGNGRRVYFFKKEDEKLSVYHFNNSTIKLRKAKDIDYTALSIFGNIFKTKRRLEEVLA